MLQQWAFPFPCVWHCAAKPGSATQSFAGCQAAQLGSVSHVAWIRQEVVHSPGMEKWSRLVQVGQEKGLSGKEVELSSWESSSNL